MVGICREISSSVWQQEGLVPNISEHEQSATDGGWHGKVTGPEMYKHAALMAFSFLSFRLNRSILKIALAMLVIILRQNILPNISSLVPFLEAENRVPHTLSTRL